MPKEGLGERIRRYREDKQWTLSKLARKAGISKAYLFQLESGQSKRPSGETLFKMAQALGVTMADLMGKQIERKQEVEIPPSLQQFAEAHAEVPETDIEMLATIKFRGDRPKSVARWEYIYRSIRMSRNLDEGQ